MRAKMFAGQSEPSGKNVPDFQRFQNFVQRLVAVPHEEIKAALDAEKQEKKRKRASRVSSGKG